MKFKRIKNRNELLKHPVECISRDLKVLWIVLKMFALYLGGNRRWVSLCLKSHHFRSLSYHFCIHTKWDVKAFRYCEYIYIYIGTAKWIMRFHNGCNKVAIELRVVKSISRFWNRAYDFRLNCTPLSSITIMNQIMDLSDLWRKITNNKRHLQPVRMRNFGPFYGVPDSMDGRKRFRYAWTTRIFFD